MRYRRHLARRATVLTTALLLVPWLSGCGSESTAATTSPTAVVTLVTDTFDGSIEQNGSRIHSFTVTNAGYSMLVGLTSLSPATVPALGVGIGSWDSSTSTCSLNLTQNGAAQSGSTGLTATPGSGNYCVRVYDGGNIPQGVTASYQVQVQHY